MKLDFSSDFKQIIVTKNEAILMNELLHSVPVEPYNLAYECAKSLIIKINDD